MLILINESQLDGWVRYNPEEAQGVIVELVLRLVAASCPRPRERRFPLGDSIGQHGPDGVLDVDLGFEPFVPEGRSIWEIGTSIQAGRKATDDYKDSTESTPEDVRRESAFVFVTPLSGRRDWEHTWKEGAQASWLQERRSRGEWKAVEVIDGTKLTDWLHQFPSVEMWLSQLILHLPSQQIETLEQRWSILEAIGEPPSLVPDVFLANRDVACTKLKEVFNDSALQLKLTTHFPGQVTDFVSAYLASLDMEARIDAHSRCLIVLRADAWNAICSQPNRLILVADTALDLNGEVGTRLIKQAHRAGHAVVFGGPHGGIPDPMSVPLHTPRVHQIQEALVKAGHGEERARTVAQRSDGNLGSLLRLLQNLSGSPEWAERTDAADLAIALMLGSWTDPSPADRSIAEGISGKAYGEWIGTLREVALRPATPLIQHEGNWKFIARYEGWYALGERLFDEHLDRLRAAAVSVLRELDPQFELHPDERYAAGIRGKSLAHSQLLRVGLAESLALLGSHPRALTSSTCGKAVGTASLAVRAILLDADWMRWASLDPLLPLLAEASPGEFLDAVDRALHSDPCPFDELFAQEDGGVFGRTYLSGLLWALETIAWDPGHLSRVMLLLGELAVRDPGGRYMNRPANSLTTILLPWLPQTCASIAQRVSALKGLLAERPSIGWKTLLSLLPRAHSMSSGTRRPEWQTTIPEDWEQGATRRDLWEQLSTYSGLAIAEAKKDVSKLAVLINYMEGLPPPASEEVLEYLASDEVMAMPEEDKLRVWQKLDDLVRKHRKFADADWAMNSEQLGSIASVAEQLAPSKPSLLHQRLFSERDLDLYERKGDFAEQEAQIENRRQRAVEEIMAVGGIEAMMAFAGAVESPWRVGIGFGTMADEDADGTVLPALLESEDKSLAGFASGYVRGRYLDRGWQWVDSIETEEWSPSQIGQFLSYLPFTPDTWDRSGRLLGQDESAYWTRTPANAFQAEGGLEIAVNQLLRHGRPLAAMRCVHRMLYYGQAFDSGMAAKVLLEAGQSPEAIHSGDNYEIAEIIKALQNDPETNPDDLFRVEWAYLPLLDGYSRATPRYLEQRLAEEPGFFCELIRMIFRSRKEDQPAEEPTEAKKNIASNAYRLLSTWKTPPGLRIDGTFDGDALTLWLDSVKNENMETGHLETSMTMAGHMLVHVPPDPDGLWIHCSAAAALNATDAEDLRTGYRSELYNSRGPHWVDPTGKPERELAARYRTRADAVDERGYPRLAATLRLLADEYDLEAERLASREAYGDLSGS